MFARLQDPVRQNRTAWAANSIRTDQSCWFSTSQHICSPFWMQSELKTKATIESTEVVPWHMCRWRHTEVTSFFADLVNRMTRQPNTWLSPLHQDLKFQTFFAVAEAAKFCPTSNASARLEKSPFIFIHRNHRKLKNAGIFWLRAKDRLVSVSFQMCISARKTEDITTPRMKYHCLCHCLVNTRPEIFCSTTQLHELQAKRENEENVWAHYED